MHTISFLVEIIVSTLLNYPDKSEKGLTDLKKRKKIILEK